MSVVTVGVESVRLFAPIGTPLSLVRIIDLQATKETMRAVAAQAVMLSRENGAKYAYLGLPARHFEVVLHFKQAGFQEFGDTYEMECPLEAIYEHSGSLRFERVQRSELDHFMEYMKELLRGSPDVVLSMILDNIREMPDDFLDLWYGREHLFLVYRGDTVVGLLDLNVKEGRISNIGVAPDQRNKGYGRQIMIYGMDLLKREGCDSAHLRVSVDNAAAIHLYESLGFTVRDRINHLIWWNR